MTKNRVTGIISVILGIIYMISALRLPELEVNDPVGPKLFPVVISVAAIVCGLILLLKKEKVTDQNRAVIINIKKDKALLSRILLTIISGLIYALLLDRLGYVISSFLFMLVLMFVTNGKRVIQNFMVSMIFSVGTYLVFAMWLGLSLPRGILRF